MTKKKKSEHDEDDTHISLHVDENDLDDLARDFIRSSGLQDTDPNVAQKRDAAASRALLLGQSDEHRYELLTTAFLSLLVWGGGFFYVGQLGLAFLFFFLLLLVAACYLFVCGLFFSFLTNPLWGSLKTLGWTFPVGWTVVGCGAIFVFLWWLSVVISTSMARKPQPIRPQFEIPFSLFLFSHIPVLGHYGQGKMIRGHFFALCALVIMPAMLGLHRLWSFAPSLSAEQASTLEQHFLGLGVALAVSLQMTVVGVLVSSLSILRLRGDVAGGGKKRKSHWIAVVVTLILMAGGLTYTSLGPAGGKLQTQLWNLGQKARERNFLFSSEILQSSAFWLERFRQPKQ